MSQNNSTLITLITGIAVVIMIAAGIMLHEEPDYVTPNTFEDNIVWLDLKKSTLDIWMRCSDPVYGIQFEFEGVKLNKSSGGYLELEGFDTSHNSRMVLAYSLQGKSIPIGEYMLLSLDASYLSGKENVFMKNMVIAGKGGTALDFGYFDLSENRVLLRSTH